MLMTVFCRFYIFLFCKMHLWRNLTFSQFFFFFNNKALIFEFEWRKRPLYEYRSSIKQWLWFFTLDWPRSNSVWLSCPFLPIEKEKKNPPLWCCLVYCLMYSSLLILQTRCFFFQWKVLTGEIFKVVLKANKLFLKNVLVRLCAGGFVFYCSK